MKLIRKRATAVLGAIALIAAAEPAAHAQVLPTAGISVGTASPCAPTVTGQIGGSPGTPVISVCLAPGALSFVGPSIGQIAPAIGPTIIGPTVIGQQITNSGTVVTPFP